MLTSNIVEVARFVREELGPLAAGTASARTLCETMLASFTFGTHVATAEHLGLHEHTVRNRLQRAEALLGRPRVPPGGAPGGAETPPPRPDLKV